jgi:hypothetical protein
VSSFIGKREPGGHKIYLTTGDGGSWVELGGRGVRSNPLGMEKQPNLGFQTEEDAWSFADRLLREHPVVVENPRSVFRLYDYKPGAEFYLSRSRPLRMNNNKVPSQPAVQLFVESRDVKKYERRHRPNQSAFKKAVGKRYGAQCAFCRVDSDDLLDAAHIIAWKDMGADVAENGLILCKLHHCALDAGLIRIDPNTLELRCANGLVFADLHVEVADIQHLPEKPDAEALGWLWKRTEV